MLPPVSRTARFRDQLQLDDESNSKIADRYTTGSSARHRVAVGDLPTFSVSEPQLSSLNKRVLRERPPLRTTHTSKVCLTVTVVVSRARAPYWLHFQPRHKRNRSQPRAARAFNATSHSLRFFFFGASRSLRPRWAAALRACLVSLSRPLPLSLRRAGASGRVASAHATHPWAKEGVAAVHAAGAGVGGSGEGVGAAASKQCALCTLLCVLCAGCVWAVRVRDASGTHAGNGGSRVRRGRGGVEMLLRKEEGGEIHGSMAGC
eukprot:scaffold6132_cov60-Phaeocystis_antarctica.AAC.1